MDLSVNLLSLQIAAMVENHISSMAARCQLLFRFHQGLQLIFARGAQAGEEWKGQVLGRARQGQEPLASTTTESQNGLCEGTFKPIQF